MKLELKRFANIAAFKMTDDSDSLVAFHGHNLEVAKISESLFAKLPEASFKSSFSKNLEIEKNPESDGLLSELQTWNAREQSLPSVDTNYKIKSVNINVTQICNLHCVYCAAGGDGSYGDPVKNISIEKTLPQLKFFLDKINPGERFHISFLGGEPLLYPEGIELIAEYASLIAKEKNINLSMKITTNGTLLNEKIISILKTYKPSLVFSMDGPPQINDALRPQKNHQSTSKVMLENLKELFAIKSEIGVLGVHAVFSRKNLAVVEAYQFFSEFNFDFMDFMFSVSEDDLQSNQLFMEQMEQVAALAWAKGKEQELRKIYSFDHYFDLLDDQRRLENHCGIGKTLAVIDSRNRIYNCPWTVGQKTDQLGQDLQINKDKLESYKESLVNRNSCQDCWAKYLCGGGCSFIHHSTSQALDVRKNELFCERTRYIIGLAIYYFSISRDLMT